MGFAKNFFKKLKERYSIILINIVGCMSFLTFELILFSQHSFSHVVHEMLIRVLVVFLFIILGLYIQQNVNKRQNVERKIRLSEENYRNAYNRTNLYKDIFTHDINNIFQNILSSIEISKEYLNNYLEKGEILIDMNTLINDQIVKGKKVVSNVQNLSLVEDMKIILSPIEVLDNLEKVVDVIKEDFQYRDIGIQIESEQSRYIVNADKLLKNIFENIFSNSIKHNQNSNIEIFIRVSKKKKNGMNFIKITIFDNGLGIPDPMKLTIFSRDFKNGGKYTGIGLGLLLVKRILEKYDGEIIVKDRVKGDYTKGSKFIILIPEFNEISKKVEDMTLPTLSR
ncbi:hypothetical protein LCGC14_1033800 [marine sediment metagenome]|uniref:Histidine kinase domain-containing protein n=1 Tax=marine sediment metagenome TaxID=412755 RepID=A0A0F9QZU1_9ZZZZ|nr:HAMP domain-containing histidine kinase [archaeon]HEC39812.1 HAMP domain-containing histidine kinase [bacterium]